ncbi:ABC transporter ATP-binding protein [Haloferax marisrubri]|uniref:ABC-type D-xylose/L-arabinose transporter n=1 Tax=Haloferax marisrubri TaxID=1544719 RepID=A0A2P4NMB2_9EURY|nr:sn-glycerol-3-phosphate ABC transporter ATP-binding protein UgpC [Haloferax marisrubri]POG54256.1 ABC transporter ATP-binding protein [Haloferax marisrubri]
MTTVEYDHVTKQFDSGDQEVVAVDDLSLDVEDGEFLVLVGPSGCGKSTTLRLLAGLETISDGEIRIKGDVMNDKKPKDRDIAMVFQNYALYPNKTVRENMSFGLEMTTNLTSDEIESRVQETASMLDINELLSRKPAALSGGQKQRVALGRAIVREPTVFLMDEPLSNLDAKLRTDMRAELQQLHEAIGVATVYVTHDQTEAMTMGDRIAILNDGELQQLATPLECYHEPANEFVASFIGSPSMNFLSLSYETNTGMGTSGSITYRFTNEQREELGEQTSVRLGIRPEDVEIATEEGPDTVEAVVRVLEPMGKESIVHFDVAGESMTASVPAEYNFESGDRVRLKLPRDRIHTFDTDGGATIFNRTRTTDEVPASARL